MKHLNSTLAILLLLPLLLVEGCKKKDSCGDPVPQASQEFLDYFFFPKGSWWIYRLQSNPTIKDSVWVNNVANGIPEDHPCSYEYQISRRHSNITNFPPSSPGYNGEDVIDGFMAGERWHLGQVSSPGDFPLMEHFFSYPFSLGDTYTKGYYLQDSGTIYTPADTFSSTLHIVRAPWEGEEEPYPNWILDLYLTPGVGITKVRYAPDKVWELERYHIKQ